MTNVYAAQTLRYPEPLGCQDPECETVIPALVDYHLVTVFSSGTVRLCAACYADLQEWVAGLETEEERP